MTSRILGLELCNAAFDGKTSEVRRLLDEGAPVNFAGLYGRTPLHMAAWYGHVEVISLLLERGAEREAKSKEGETPADYAREGGNGEAANYLDNWKKASQDRPAAASQSTPVQQPDTKTVAALSVSQSTPAKQSDTKPAVTPPAVQSYNPSQKSSSVALKDVSVRELSVILENLSFASLVEPFEKNGVSGKTIGRMISYRTIVDIGKGRINEVVAQTFYEDYLLGWKQAGGIPRYLLQPPLVPTPILKANTTSSQEAKKSLAGNIDGTRGIMLVRTTSLGKLLEREDMTSEDILTKFWIPHGDIYSLLSREDFMEATWDELPGLTYAVISYQWTQKWHSMIRFILISSNRVSADWLWIDCLCLDQMDNNKIATISRSDEIYCNAKEYHLIEIGSLSRGWVLFELSSVKLAPIIHTYIQDPAAKELIKKHLASTGFEGSAFKVEADRDVVGKKIIGRYESVANFDREIVKIVNKFF